MQLFGTIKKRQKKIKNGLLTVFLLGLICGGISFEMIHRFAVKRPAKKTDLTEIVAPYYDRAVFKNSSLKNASVSAGLKIPIIMYHYVEYVRDLNDFIRKRLDISPDLFEKELKALKENDFQTYFVKDIPDILGGEIQYDASKSAVLTFDDGYEDFYSVVYPLLKKYQLKGTVYIIYDYIGRRGFLNENQIKELVDSDLVEVGSHTLDHLYLKTLAKSVAKKQIEDSKTQLEKRFHINIKTFAYPYGAFNEQDEVMVKEAPYSAAVSVISGTMQSQGNLFHLYRIRPGIFTAGSIVKVLEGIKK